MGDATEQAVSCQAAFGDRVVAPQSQRSSAVPSPGITEPCLCRWDAVPVLGCWHTGMEGGCWGG